MQSLEGIERYTRGLTFEEFRDDDKTVDAVVRNLGIIGEAARQVPPDVQERYPDVPWAQMRGMRNVVIHEYSTVSVRIIWQTIKENLLPLAPTSRHILEQEP